MIAGTLAAILNNEDEGHTYTRKEVLIGCRANPALLPDFCLKANNK